MRHKLVAALVGIGLSCGLAACKEEPPRPPPADEPEPAAVVQSPATPTAAPAVPDAEPPRPEPTTPAELEMARKQAMVDGRDRDVIKYCEMSQFDPKKADPQALLGCSLAACRVGDLDKSKAWAANLPKPLKDQQIKICQANAVR